MNAELDHLTHIQRWMLSALIAPSERDAEQAASILLPGPHLSAAECLAIYQRSYILRLLACLEEQFPATRHVLGRDLFRDFSRDYLRDCPSNSYTLYELGQRFSQWLEEHRPDRALPEEEREAWIDFLIDLTNYEHKLFCLFDASFPDNLCPAVIEDSDENLTLSSGLILTEYRFPVAWYYHEIRAGRTPAVPPPHRSYTIILRQQFITHSYPITQLHYQFLINIQQGMNLPQALRSIVAKTGNSLEQVEQSWKNEVRGPWIKAGFFVRKVN